MQTDTENNWTILSGENRYFRIEMSIVQMNHKVNLDALPTVIGAGCATRADGAKRSEADKASY